MGPLRFLLRFVGAVQLFFGILFTFVPAGAAVLFDLRPGAPAWVNWLFVMMGARFLGFGFAMFVAAREPLANLAWINTMILIQVADWVSTLAFLVAGDVAFTSVAPAAILPVVFVTGLLRWHPARSGSVPRVVVS